MARSYRARRASGGFTLLEALVVLAIVSAFMMLSFGVIAKARAREFEATSRAELSTIVTALTEYHAEQGLYPAAGHPDDQDPNLDGRLYKALFRRAVNPCGTLVTWEPTQLGVAQGDGYRQATGADLEDPDAKVVFLDQHLRPYHYREREARSTAASRWLNYELWCEGMNREDDGGNGDDLTERR